MNLNTLKESFKKGQDKIKNLATGAALFGILAGAPSFSNDKTDQSNPEEAKTEQVEKDNNLTENTKTPTITAKAETNSNDELDDLDDLSNLDLTEEAKKYEGQLAPHELLEQETQQLKEEGKKLKQEYEKAIREWKQLKNGLIDIEARISNREIKDMNEQMAKAIFQVEKDMKLNSYQPNQKTAQLIKAAHQFKKDNPHLFSK